MTNDGLPLTELPPKSAEGDVLRAFAETALQLRMDAYVEGLIDAGRRPR